MGNTPSYTYINKTRSDSRGGGITIGIDIQFNFKILDEILPSELAETNIEILAVQIFHQEVEIILINIYIPLQQKFGKRNMKKLANWIQNLTESAQNKKIIITGDFNTNYNPIPFMSHTNTNLQHTYQRNSQIQTITDWTLYNFEATTKIEMEFLAKISDHTYLLSEIQIKVNKQTKKENTIKIPCKNKSYNLCTMSAQNSETTKQFIQNVMKNKKKFITYNIKRLKIRMKEEQKNTFEDLCQKINENLRTQTSQIAFQTMKRMTILKPQKRDGDICKCMLNEQNKITNNQEEIINECLKVLASISKTNNEIRKLDCPNLRPLNEEEVRNLQHQMSKDKAVTLDGFSDKFFKEHNNWKLLSNWWSKESLQLLEPHIFNARLIPLNKKWPNIPKSNEFRPIIVLSSAYKWIELRFLSKLQSYLTNTLDRNQTGFIKKCQTQMNILQLIQHTQAFKKKDKQCLIFIDLTNAYNTVNREILYEYLNKEQILDKKEIEFLKYIHDKVTIEKKMKFKYGLHQGSSISPPLFNIYMEKVFKEIKEELGEDLFYKLFADDLAFSIKAELLVKTLKIIKKHFDKHNLILNSSKSAIMNIRNHQIIFESESILNIPYKTEYTFLGVKMNSNGSIAPHIEAIEKRIAYLNSHLKFIGNKIQIKNQYLLWMAFIRPYMIYSSSLIGTQNQKIQEKFNRLWKKSFKFLLNLPKNTPNLLIDHIFENVQKVQMHQNSKVQKRIQIRYNQKEENLITFEYKFNFQISRIIPENLKQLLYMAKHKCKCHSKHLSLSTIADHNKQNIKTLLNDMFNLESLKSNKSIKLKKIQNEKIIQKLIDVSQNIKIEEKDQN